MLARAALTRPPLFLWPSSGDAVSRKRRLVVAAGEQEGIRLFFAGYPSGLKFAIPSWSPAVTRRQRAGQ
jgi:hypothetical protein